MRRVVLINDLIHFEAQNNQWTPLLPLLANPCARPGILLHSTPIVNWAKLLDTFIPFDRKVAYHLGSKRHTYFLDGWLIMSYRATEKSIVDITNWKAMTKEMGKEKQKFVKEYLE